MGTNERLTSYYLKVRDEMVACQILCFERSYLVIANAGMSRRDWGNCDRLRWTVANIWWLGQGILQRYYFLITTLSWFGRVNLTAFKFWAILTIENITFQDFLKNVCRGDIFAGSENLTVTRKCRWRLWVFIRYLFSDQDGQRYAEKAEYSHNVVCTPIGPK